ncbi:hypothetical protein FQA39_LY03054 [Lamprigera yunnana]|nr:hypothetical protein FQA39_LY03054 [Lamprigera yunnana]
MSRPVIIKIKDSTKHVEQPLNGSADALNAKPKKLQLGKGEKTKDAVDDKQIKEVEVEVETPKADKVKDITDLFERQISSNKMQDTNKNKEVEDKERKLSSSESSSSESSDDESESDDEDNKMSPKIKELKSHFEIKKGKTKKASKKSRDSEKDHTLSPSTITNLERVENLVHEIKVLEDEIQGLSKDDVDKGSRINEDLVRILINLDDINDKNDVLQSKRQSAIEFVQQCIRLLRREMRN